MIRFEGHLEVSGPPALVFDQLADMASLSEWNPNVTRSRRVSGDRFEIGSRYESALARGPMRMTAHSELTAVEVGTSVTYEGSIGSFWSVDTLEFESTPSGTRVTFRNETEPPTWLKPVTGLLNAAFQRQARTAIVGAQSYLQRLQH